MTGADSVSFLVWLNSGPSCSSWLGVPAPKSKPPAKLPAKSSPTPSYSAGDGTRQFQEARPHLAPLGGGWASTHFTASQKCSSSSCSFFVPGRGTGSLVPDILGVRDETAYPTLRAIITLSVPLQWPCQCLLLVLPALPSSSFVSWPLPAWTVLS